jgi:short-subunit dehydrogenase
VNSAASFTSSRRPIRSFASKDFGHLVNTASVAGLTAAPFLSVYVATKHAVVGLSKSLRVEAAERGCA